MRYLARVRFSFLDLLGIGTAVYLMEAGKYVWAVALIMLGTVVSTELQKRYEDQRQDPMP